MSKLDEPVDKLFQLNSVSQTAAIRFSLSLQPEIKGVFSKEQVLIRFDSVYWLVAWAECIKSLGEEVPMEKEIPSWLK